MVNADEVREGLNEWLENPYWADYYNNAPSEKCREYIALDFHYSDTEDEEVAEAMDKVGETLSLEDWKYVYEHTEGPERARIAQIIEKG
ncbi:MAG: hypothetical protein J6Y20_07655 [Lachnospiraceae bacterium]|nr:hypothetical protein [Lachnospiraceae bacterium]